MITVQRSDFFTGYAIHLIHVAKGHVGSSKLRQRLNSGRKAKDKGQKTKVEGQWLSVNGKQGKSQMGKQAKDENGMHRYAYIQQSTGMFTCTLLKDSYL